VSDIATALKNLAADPEFCRRLGEGGRCRAVAHYDWETKADFMSRIYQAAVEPTAIQSQTRLLDSMPW
jgi:starch synthase